MENEEIKKRIENAQKFKEFLKSYLPQTQARFIYAKNPDAYREIDPTLKEAADGFFDLRKDYFTYRNTIAPQDKKPEKKDKEYKKEEFSRIHGSESADEGLGGNPEEKNPEEQPRTRFEQMEKAGKAITEGNAGNDDWGYYEPVPPSPPPPSSPGPRPMTQRIPGLRQIPSKRALRQSLRRPGQQGSSRGSPILKNKTKKQLKRKLLGAAKKRAAAALIGSFGLPSIVIGLLIFIFIVVFIILIIAMGCYVVNNPIGDLIGVNYCKIEQNNPPQPIPEPTQEPGPGPGPQCETNDFTKCLKDDFNMIIVGTPGRERVEDLYDILSELGVSGTYKNLLKNSGPTYVFFINGDTTCAARVRNFLGYTYMTFEDFGPDYCKKTDRKDRITHETGHVIKGGHARLFQKYESEAYWPKDRNCYYYEYNKGFVSPYHFINTYSTKYAKENGIPISGSNESMADSMALYVRPQSPLGNFPSQCPKGYNWIKTNIFGGTPL